MLRLFNIIKRALSLCLFFPLGLGLRLTVVGGRYRRCQVEGGCEENDEYPTVSSAWETEKERDHFRRMAASTHICMDNAII